MKELVVTKKYDNKKLDRFILDSLPHVNINTFYKLLRKKDIKINNKRVNKNVEIHTNDIICVYVSNNLKSENIKLDVIYEDNNILIINKPAGIEVTGQGSLSEILQNKYKENGIKIMPCHRLDRNTTGLVIFAKNDEALKILENKFKNHEIKKYYKALVYGVPQYKQKKLEAFLFKDSKKSMVYISDIPKKWYQKIVTSYKVIDIYENKSALLEIEIQTGRTHQIRAHLAHVGLPIIGDGKYGINKVNKEFGYKVQQLCAYKLRFEFIKPAGILEYLNKKEIIL